MQTALHTLAYLLSRIGALQLGYPAYCGMPAEPMRAEYVQVQLSAYDYERATKLVHRQWK